MARPALPILLRLAEQAVEAAQQVLGKATQAVVANHAAQEQLKVDVAAAYAAVQGRTQSWALQDAAVFQQAATVRQAKLVAELATLQAAEAEARTALQAAFVVQKRYETLLARQAAEAAKARAKAGQVQLDEVAGNLSRNSTKPGSK
jgi:flagellar export protein FliJ